MKYESYTLDIMGTRRTHMEFTSLEDLRTETAAYLTASEQASVLPRLLDFDRKPGPDGYVENKWRNMSVCAYPKEDATA